ncbi:O-antigen polymerase [Desulfurispirillum indicum S5]|uniref:O-antigen polymerase n=1 Tax=Desulfurispirillum indicum (strain ATCC BAA-1389 / DSM 22839 / S5) TaxID=653733 RepID=E6W6N7_DESIS|nr:O-antigen ligase family protein [Desulfurispirillum indicum]ADU65037.1 O-antigen polymerase [Desulfurispirillum indicum S5]
MILYKCCTQGIKKATGVILKKLNEVLVGFFPLPAGAMRTRSLAAESIGIAGVICIFLGLGASRSLVSLGEMLVILALLLACRHVAAALKRDPIAWMLLIWIVYILARTYFALWEFPETTEEQWRIARRMARLGLVIPIAWWLGATLRGSMNALVLALVSLVLVIVFQIVEHDGDIGFLWGDARLHFMRNAQDFALYSSVAISGLIVFAPRIISFYAYCKALWVFKLIAFLVVSVTVGLAFAVADVRAQWVALGIMAVILFLLLTFRVVFVPGNRLKSSILLIAFTALLLVSLSFAWSSASERFLQEQDVLVLLLQGEYKDLRTSSIGHRVHMWRGALSEMEGRWLFGWGPGSSDVVMKIADIPPETKIRFRHFHSSYVEVLVRTGVVGSFLFFSIVFTIMAKFLRIWRQGKIPGDVALFVGFACIALMAGNATEAFFGMHFGTFFFVCIMAFAYQFVVSEGVRPLSSLSKGRALKVSVTKSGAV